MRNKKNVLDEDVRDFLDARTLYEIIDLPWQICPCCSKAVLDSQKDYRLRGITINMVMDLLNIFLESGLWGETAPVSKSNKINELVKNHIAGEAKDEEPRH